MGNPVLEKSFRFSVRIVRACDYLRRVKKETVLSKQLLRSGTSIGANVSESQQAQSRADFVSKLSIALKEANETDYWLRLLHETNYLTNSEFDSLYSDFLEIKRLLSSIVHKVKNDRI